MSQSAQSAVKFSISVEIFEKFHQGNIKKTQNATHGVFFSAMFFLIGCQGKNPNVPNSHIRPKFSFSGKLKRKFWTSILRLQNTGQSLKCFFNSENPSIFPTFLMHCSIQTNLPISKKVHTNYNTYITYSNIPICYCSIYINLQVTT